MLHSEPLSQIQNKTKRQNKVCEVRFLNPDVPLTCGIRKIYCLREKITRGQLDFRAGPVNTAVIIVRKAVPHGGGFLHVENTLISILKSVIHSQCKLKLNKEAT